MALGSRLLGGDADVGRPAEAALVDDLDQPAGRDAAVGDHEVIFDRQPDRFVGHRVGEPPQIRRIATLDLGVGLQAHERVRTDVVEQGGRVRPHRVEPGQDERPRRALDRHLMHPADGAVLIPSNIHSAQSSQQRHGR